MACRDLSLSEDEYLYLARLIYEEEDRMLPDISGRRWADLDCGEVAHYENLAIVAVRGLEAMRIGEHQLVELNANINHGPEAVPPR